MKLTIAQLNPLVGDIDGNLKKITETTEKASKEKSDLVVFPELFLTGYPPRDLLEREWFINRVQKAIEEVVKASSFSPDTGIIFGAPLLTNKETGRGLYNAALFVFRGMVIGVQHKSLLPTYDVFDEARYFDPAPDITVTRFKDSVVGISICEDTWNAPELWHRQYYDVDPIETLARKGVTIMINISASPFTVGKEEIRFRIIQNHARKFGVPFILVNQVGGNDELIFDGGSICLDAGGEAIDCLPLFAEDTRTVDTASQGKPGCFIPMGHIESIYKALVLGLRDYIRKCGFKKAVIGMSGGIDSALVACIAREAIGSENMLGITMPGPYSSPGSIEDSKTLAGNIGMELKTVSIMDIYESYRKTFKGEFGRRSMDVAEENIQARVRGNILMAISNKFGHLVLATGNKSELAVGYCTMYGDMSGGVSVISDVPKTMVYEIARYINREKEIIPQEIIDKPPSAELRLNQRDQDTLPPYEVLDPILHYYLEDGLSESEIIEKNYAPDIVSWVIKAVNKNEYKRRQAPPGLKVTSKAFGYGRRIPIAAKF